jgi:hypothetical protein
LIVTFGNVTSSGTNKIKATKNGKDVEFAKRTKVSCDKNHVTGITTTNKVIMTENFPRIHSSHFQIFPINQECFKLKGSNGNWIRLTNDGELVADIESSIFIYFQTTSFVAISDFETKSNNSFKLKVCRQEQWLNLISELENESINVTSNSNAITLTYEKVKEIRGVNLGGWFIPEVWMNPSFFGGSGLGWGGSLCAMVRLKIFYCFRSNIFILYITIYYSIIIQRHLLKLEY